MELADGSIRAILPETVVLLAGLEKGVIIGISCASVQSPNEACISHYSS